MASAAAYAYGAQVYASLNKPAYDTYAADLAQRAKRAWDWAIANPNVLFYNNDASRGTQGLGAGQQETDDTGRAGLRLVAAIYLYALTGDATYRNYVDSHYTEVQMMRSWWLSPYDAGVNRPLLYYASLPGATASVAQSIRTRYTELWERPDYAGWGAIADQRDPYRAYLNSYHWGSNGIKGLMGGMFADQGLYGLSQHSAAEIADAGAAYLHYLQASIRWARRTCRTWAPTARRTRWISSSTDGSTTALRGTACVTRSTAPRPASWWVDPTTRSTTGTNVVSVYR